MTSETAGPGWRVGAVAIGRNEGERLRTCLMSLAPQSDRVVYVDSGSTDDSVAIAESIGVEVVHLDLSKPFTAARARNAGFRQLLSLEPQLTHVQFIDGDCELQPDWLAAARSAFEAEPSDLAVVCGRRRERFPERSVYNRMCDVEWDTPVGEATFCGGDSVMRADAFQAVGGFRDDFIAGEEPELCVRLREAGWRIRRIGAEMTLHDAAITEWGQWWKRVERSGFAYAAGAWTHGQSDARHNVREHRRIWFWGAALPTVAVAAAPVTLGTSLALFGAYPFSAMRAYRAVRRRGRTREDAGVFAALTLLGKAPEVVGAARFHWQRTAGQTPQIIEYKGPALDASRSGPKSESEASGDSGEAKRS
ncbi:MAG: glycosyltransferase [Myxococcota bacterium]